MSDQYPLSNAELQHAIDRAHVLAMTTAPAAGGVQAAEHLQVLMLEQQRRAKERVQP